MRSVIRIAFLLLLAGIASAEVVDSISQTRSGAGGLYRASEDSDIFQNDDAWTICAFVDSGNIIQNTYYFGLFRESTSNTILTSVRQDNTGNVEIRDGFSTLSQTGATDPSANTWYSYCLRSAGTGGMTLSFYQENGTLIEDVTGTDTADPFTGATALRFTFGIGWNGSTSAWSNALENDSALHAVWTSDIGNTGVDSYASDPLNYMGTTNPPDWFESTDPETGDITVSGTVQDQSASAHHFTFTGDGALSNEGGPTVTDFASGAPLYLLRHRRL